MKCPVCNYVGPSVKQTSEEKSLAIKKGMNDSPNRIGRPRKFDYKKINRLRARGFSYRDIAQKLGMSLASVSRALKQKDQT